jgi:hypothetical protein
VEVRVKMTQLQIFILIKYGLDINTYLENFKTGQAGCVSYREIHFKVKGYVNPRCVGSNREKFCRNNRVHYKVKHFKRRLTVKMFCVVLLAVE